MEALFIRREIVSVTKMKSRTESREYIATCWVPVAMWS
jgi:hypothetical protein